MGNKERRKVYSKKEKWGRLEVAHYNHIWLLAIRATYDSLRNGDRQFANKCRAVWLKCVTEMEELGMDAIQLQLEDFTKCDTVEELKLWMMDHTILPQKAEQERLVHDGVLFPSQVVGETMFGEAGEVDGEGALGAITGDETEEVDTSAQAKKKKAAKRRKGGGKPIVIKIEP